MAETILIVDDEEPVRRTFQDWLRGSQLGCTVLVAADSETALNLANEHPIDLAILDWNLGSGTDGLRLLEDLVEFRPDLVAILVTGFAHQATPLDALRMGVRDYLDKNQDLNRDTFLAAVNKQLDRIRPAKRQREFNHTLLAFREAIDKVLPLVQSAATLNDPVPLPDAIRGLFRFLQRTTRAADGTLLVRHLDAEGVESFLAYGMDGQPLPNPTVPFSRSLAATVVSVQEPCVMNQPNEEGSGVDRQSFEKGRRSILAAPVTVASGTHVVLELFDKQGDGFTEEDRRLVAAAAELGGELLRSALAERQTSRTLFDAVGAALEASKTMAGSMDGAEPSDPDAPPPAVIMDRLRESLMASGNSVVDAETSLRLAEAVRVLGIRHGPVAVRHCVRVVESMRELLDNVTGIS